MKLLLILLVFISTSKLIANDNKGTDLNFDSIKSVLKNDFLTEAAQKNKTKSDAKDQRKLQIKKAKV